jgi:anti-sigma factor RsiW
MESCARTKRLLPLAVTGDVSERKLNAIRIHIATCENCRREEQAFLALISAARVHVRDDDRLPSPVRARICREAAERAQRRRLPWSLRLPILASTPRLSLVGTAVALLAALTILPLVQRERAHSGRDSEIRAIRVVAEGGIVRLAWSDGKKVSYTIRKSDNPRGLPEGEAHVVKGNVWTDANPESSPVVFYRVE